MERYFVVDHMKLNYEGLLNVNDFYRMVDGWFHEKGYDKRERKSIEHVSTDHTYVELELLPWKKVTDYAKNVIKVDIIMHNLKEVEVEKDGHKIKMQQGKVSIVFDAFLDTDYENRWDQSPMYYFLRTLMDKFVFKLYMDRLEKDLLDDVNQLHTGMKSFLNLYRF